jgi:glutathione S-transferase
MPTLVIGNKCYSSWSMRPWLVMKHFGIPFEEVLIPFGTPLNSPEWKAQVLRYSPAGKVPVLVDRDVTVWESLAIIDHLADEHPDLPIWPRDRAARGLARALAAEMHAGFAALRAACPMDLGKRYAARDRGPAVAADVERVGAIWRTARERFGRGGPFLFGAFCAADAMYAPVVTRFSTYSLPADGTAQAYIEAVSALPAFREWREAGLAEPWIVPDNESGEEPIEVFRQARRAA